MIYDLLLAIYYFQSNSSASLIASVLFIAAMILIIAAAISFIYGTNRIIRHLDQLRAVNEKAFGPLIQTDRKKKLLTFLELDVVSFLFVDIEVRNSILLDLPPELVNQIRRSNIPEVDMANIVYTVSNWSTDAFEVLIESIDKRLGNTSEAKKLFTYVKKQL
jgi:hypothetical protein